MLSQHIDPLRPAFPHLQASSIGAVHRKFVNGTSYIALPVSFSWQLTYSC